MKKFISVLTALSLIAGTTTTAFAKQNTVGTTSSASAITQSTKLTPAQKQARDTFLKVYHDLMKQLTSLKQQIQSAAKANNSAVSQIKEKLKSKTAISGDILAKLKNLASQRKAITEQAKQLNQQRNSLKSQYKDAVKAKDSEKMKSIKQQILVINKKISDLKAKDKEIKAQIAPLKEQIKRLKDSNNQLKANVKSQLQQAKAIQETIKTLENEKSQLWTTYKSDIKNKDYAAAETVLKAIIAKESDILSSMKQRGSILNQILSSLK